MLQPRTAMSNVEALGSSAVKRRISSSSGRLRKKKVPVNWVRFARWQISLCRSVPYENAGLVSRSLEGSRFHSQVFSRINRLTGDLLRISGFVIELSHNVRVPSGDASAMIALDRKSVV